MNKKYRVWSVVDRCLIYSHTERFLLTPEGEIVDGEGETYRANNIVQFCTGLTISYHDKLIYEGDIINTMKNRYVVEYDESHAKYIGRGLFHAKEIVDAYTIVGGILLGNVFENPEHLK